MTVESSTCSPCPAPCIIHFENFKQFSTRWPSVRSWRWMLISSLLQHEDEKINRGPFEPIQRHSTPLQMLKLQRFLNLNRNADTHPPFTFSFSSAPLLTPGSKPCYHLGTGDIPAVFPWLSVAFVCGFRAGVGQCHHAFQADVTPTIEGEHREI